MMPVMVKEADLNRIGVPVEVEVDTKSKEMNVYAQ